MVPPTSHLPVAVVVAAVAVPVLFAAPRHDARNDVVRPAVHCWGTYDSMGGERTTPQEDMDMDRRVTVNTAQHMCMT